MAFSSLKACICRTRTVHFIIWSLKSDWCKEELDWTWYFRFMHPDTEEKIVLMSVSHETQAVTQDSQILTNAIEWWEAIFFNTIQMQIRHSGISADATLKVYYTYSSALSALYDCIELEITPGSCVQIKSTKGQDHQSFRMDGEFIMLQEKLHPL